MVLINQAHELNIINLVAFNVRMLHPQFTPFPFLETDRLHLRAIEDSDDESLFLLRSDEKVNEYLESFRHENIQMTRDLISRIKKAISDNESIFWVITLKNSDTLIGTICLWQLDKENDYAETGYLLHPVQQGKGLMQEALKKVIAYGFETLQLKAIGAYTHQLNKKSIQLLVKNNFTHTGNKEETHEVIYTLENSDWK